MGNESSIEVDHSEEAANFSHVARRFETSDDRCPFGIGACFRSIDDRTQDLNLLDSTLVFRLVQLEVTSLQPTRDSFQPEIVLFACSSMNVDIVLTPDRFARREYRTKASPLRLGILLALS